MGKVKRKSDLNDRKYDTQKDKLQNSRYRKKAEPNDSQSPKAGKKVEVSISNIHDVGNLGKVIYDCFHGSQQTSDLVKSNKNSKANSNFDLITVLNDPFNCAFLLSFIEQRPFLDNLMQELLSVPLTEESNDLYQKKHSVDLQSIGTPAVQSMCNFLRYPVREFIEKATGIKLIDKVSICCSEYGFSDVLLCHDDALPDETDASLVRRVAYVFYLVPEDWEENFGGTLDLFSSSRGLPCKIVQRLCPKFNSFVFFEVSRRSYHQVSEVLVKNKKRLSINGWFWGDPVVVEKKKTMPIPVYLPFTHAEERLIYSWINPIFLEPNTQGDIRKEFEEKSEIQLTGFLQQKMYTGLLKELQSQTGWHYTGPPCKRNCQVIDRLKYLPMVSQFIQIMESEAMFLIMSQLTGLELHRLGPKDDSEASGTTSNTDKKVSAKSGGNISSKDGGGSCSVETSTSLSKSNTRKYDSEIATSSGVHTRGSKRERASKADVKSSKKSKNSVGDSGTKKSHSNPEMRSSGSGMLLRSTDVGKKTSHNNRKDKGITTEMIEDGNGSDRGQLVTKEIENFGNVPIRGLQINDWCNWRVNARVMVDIKEKRLSEMSRDEKIMGEVTTEVRRWSWGCYSSMVDEDIYYNPAGILDAMLFCGVPTRWASRMGGDVVYTGDRDEEPLLSVQPASNCLALVYRDNETVCFTKYINGKCRKVLGDEGGYYEMYCGFMEMMKAE